MLNKSMDFRLPENILTLFDTISKKGYLVGIIGGFCRDYLLDGSISHDIDLEIRPLGEIDTTKLYEFLQTQYKTSLQKNYNILTVEIDDYSIEIGLPRVESFNSSIGHSNFSFTFISDLDFSEGFKRRDFTINAIMFLYRENKWEVVDPLGGVKDLERKKLVECDQISFPKDPVRCLRALRFSLKLDFNLSPFLKQQLDSFDVSSVTSHYLKTESVKSKRPIKYLTSLFEIDELVKDETSFSEDIDCLLKLSPKLSLEDKELLIDRLKISKKGILKLNLNQSIKSLVESDPEHLESSLLIIEKADTSSQYKAYLLEHYFVDFNFDQFIDFTQSRYTLTQEDKKQPAKLYRSIILKNRLRMSC